MGGIPDWAETDIEAQRISRILGKTLKRVELKLCFENFIDDLGIRFATRCLHYLADKKAKQLVISTTIGYDLTLV